MIDIPSAVRITPIGDHDLTSPSHLDLFLLQARLDCGKAVPEGFRVLDGNMQSSAIVAVVMRHEIEHLLLGLAVKALEEHHAA